jgi:hypothetical protein
MVIVFELLQRWISGMDMSVIFHESVCFTLPFSLIVPDRQIVRE